MGYLERLRTEAKAVDIVGVVACGLLCLLLFDLMLKFVDIDVFRADDLRYKGSYEGKFVSEGRWLNWLFFSTLRLADVKLVACASVLCFAVFSWCVFRNFLDCVSAALATLVCLFIPPVHLLNEWPLTSFLTFVLLALAGLLRDKMCIPAFSLVFGVLFNGVLSHFYFLLPLLFIGTLHRRHLTLAPPL